MHGSEADALIKWGRMTVTAGKSTWRESDLQKPTPLFMDEGTSAHQGCHFDTIIEMVYQNEPTHLQNHHNQVAIPPHY